MGGGGAGGVGGSAAAVRRGATKGQHFMVPAEHLARSWVCVSVCVRVFFCGVACGVGGFLGVSLVISVLLYRWTLESATVSFL